MRIILFGYGKMGKTIEEIAISRGHQVPFKIDVDNREELETVEWDTLDVGIEFTQPDSAVGNIELGLNRGVPVVSGTTGWLHDWGRVEKACQQNDGSFFYASNFSLGVNLFFRLNKIMASLMNNYQDDYDVAVEEIHHIQKKDAPSGTAITLAEGILEHFSRKKRWVADKLAEEDELAITSIREGTVPGTHTITYSSPIDELQIKHTAFGRQGFALGAVMVAEWIKDRKGMLSMDDYMETVLGKSWT